METLEGIVLEGLPISKGIAIGSAFFCPSREETIPEFSVEKHELEKEIIRYRQALIKSRQDLIKLQNILKLEGTPEIVSIIESHLEMLKDPLMTTEMEANIRKYCKNTESVVQIVIAKYRDRFQNLQDPYFKERVHDVIDVSRRILGHLYPAEKGKISDIPLNSVVVAAELVPSDIAEASSFFASAFITASGGMNSHAAIIARAKGIPYIAGIDIQSLKKMKIETMIVDGEKGRIMVNPSQETLNRYKELQGANQSYHQKLEGESHLEAVTQDGCQVRIYANVENIHDVDLLEKHSAAGVGLFRSEYLFLTRKTFPSEEEQFEIYKEIAQRVSNKPVVIRVFDIGGDKMHEFLSQVKTNESYYPYQEPNPVLGCRAIRYLLRNEELLRHQLRAILRASAFGDVKISIPMVSDLSELKAVRSIVESVQQELIEEGVAIRENIPVGCMIEVPSIALMADVFFKEADFLSIGTNDLIQYLLAADRSNPNFNSVYSEIHLSLLRIIRMIVEAGEGKNKPLILCGEMAANPKLLPVLLGLGIREFSVAARHIPLIKHMVRKLSLSHAKEITKRAFQIFETEKLNTFIEEEFQKI